MLNLVILFVHVIATLARLLGPAESVLRWYSSKPGKDAIHSSARIRWARCTRLPTIACRR